MYYTLAHKKTSFLLPFIKTCFTVFHEPNFTTFLFKQNEVYPQQRKLDKSEWQYDKPAINSDEKE